MCGTCGCGEDEHITYRNPNNPDSHLHEHSHFHGDKEHSHAHHHEHDHSHPHSHDHSHDYLLKPGGGALNSQTIQLQRKILSKNDLLAERNRGHFEALNIVAFNLVSSPGSGKTAVLERTILEKGSDFNCYVIEGDQQTMNDAERIKSAGAPVIQINTGNGCHLDALMVNKAMKDLKLPENSTLFIENVGNLVCPALFDLGETKRVVIISVTEGEDKPAKYPTMFETAQLCLINKTDLLPYLDFDLEKFRQIATQVNHHIEFIEISAKTGEGFNQWYEWIVKHRLSETD
ncbi:MAG: hydrogenase nickel incorporation protein HypB [Bacteroidales bacterium]|nr:hydrogenase nickel incorporation protein HypB [Bacteroidales bacterium]